MLGKEAGGCGCWTDRIGNMPNMEIWKEVSGTGAGEVNMTGLCRGRKWAGGDGWNEVMGHNTDG